MSQLTAIERSRRHPGRYVWFSRIPFVLAAAAGAAAIIGMKLYGFEQIPITAVACGLIIFYALLVQGIPILRVREDQLADNCYYLGFLYTLVSLAWALYDFSETGDIEAIVSNFGIALGSTIVGIVLRVFINQARRDVLETERDARMELADAVVRMRVQLDDAVLALGSFCRVAQQTAAEQINVVADQSTKALEQGVARFGESSTTVMKRIEEAFTEFRDHAATLNKTAAETVKAVKALLARIEKIDAPSDLVKKRLEPALSAVDKAAARLSERLEQDEGLMRAYSERTAILQEDLQIGTTRLRETLAELAATGDAAGQAATSTREAAARMADLVSAAEAVVREQALAAESVRSEANRLAQMLVEGQQRLGNAAKDGIDQVTADLRNHNDSLAAEIERSRRLVEQTSTALVKLADYVTDRVAERVS